MGCPQCGGYQSREVRVDEVLGSEFKKFLSLKDLPPKQQEEVRHRIKYCSDRCADAGAVHNAFRRAAK